MQERHLNSKTSKSGRTYRNRKRKCRKIVTESANADYIQLLQWMKPHGFNQQVVLHPANFCDTGRGLATKRPISANTVIISIPEKLLITTKTVLNSYLGPYFTRFSNGNERFSPMQVLSIFVMCEKLLDTKSWWHPYFCTLPTQYSTPAFFSHDEIRILPESLQERINQQEKKINEAYNSMCDLLETLQSDHPHFRGLLTKDLFLWAWFTINTRAVYMKSEQHPLLNSEPDIYALAPYLDLLNHSPTAQVKAGFDEKNRVYNITTLTACERYSQVFINYGPHDNHTLLLEYGFFVPNNPQHSIEFHLDHIVAIWRKLRQGDRNKIKDENKLLNLILEENLVRDLTCTSEGLSWSLQRTLEILSLNRLQRSWTTGKPLERDAIFLNELGKLCIEEKLNARSEQLREKKITENSLAINLLQEEIRLLNTVKEKLKIITFDL